MDDYAERLRDQSGAVTAEYAALTAAVAALMIVPIALRWVVEHQDVVIHVIETVITMITQLVGLR